MHDEENTSGKPHSPSPIEWFSTPPKAAIDHRVSTLIKTSIGLGVAAILWSLGWQALAYFGGGLAIFIGGASLISTRFSIIFEHAAAGLGKSIGITLSTLTLTPLYVLLFPIIRFFDVIAGRDPMGYRRSPMIFSYWRSVDDPQRVKRGVKRSFMTERIDQRERGGLISLLLLITFALFAAEIFLRLMGFGHVVLYQQNPHYGYIPAPQQHVIRRGHEISINQWGMRAPEFAAKKPANVTRIIMLGDSTLWGGSYTSQERIYARQLETQLNQRLADTSKRVEVLNISANGWGPAHKLGYLNVHGDFGADIAVIAFPFADLHRPLSHLSMTPFYPAQNPPHLALQEVLYHLSWRWRGQLIGKYTREEREALLQDGVEAYRRLAQALHDRGLEVWLEMLPSRQAVESEGSERERRYLSAIKEGLKSLPFTYHFSFADHPLRTAYQERYNAQTIYHDSGHLNALGHDAYAEYLVERLSHSARFSLGERPSVPQGGGEHE